MSVAHPESRMAIRRRVVLRPAEPLDEERGEALTDDRSDLGPRIVEPVDRDEHRLMRVHVVVEAPRELDRLVVADRIERGMAGAERTSRHGPSVAQSFTLRSATAPFSGTWPAGARVYFASAVASSAYRCTLAATVFV